MNTLHPNTVVDWSKQFLQKADKELSADELKEQNKYAILVQQPNDKALLTKLLDESSQIHDSKKLAIRMNYLFKKYGVPTFMSPTDKLLLKVFQWVGLPFHAIAVPIFKRRLQSDTAKVIINEKRSFLTKHLQQRKESQIGQNVNLLGEVVLGDKEADTRYFRYLEALKDPQINYISIKISGIYAQIISLNHAANKEELCDRLTKIYQQAIDYPTTDLDGVVTPKFVNLDMEEYKDMELTLDVFCTVLSKPQFKNYTAGIVVQAYLPDSVELHKRLLEFAHKRVAAGGAPLKMRLVKGANLAMESIVSSLKGWEVPIFSSKVEVDANYLKILDVSLQPENAKVLRVGVASHNFFTIGYAYLLGQLNGVEEYVSFEMLEGMANHLPRVMRSMQKQVILYTPVVKNEHFLNAVSYLVRRLDENTGDDNFLRYSFNLHLESKEWEYLQQQFLEACELKDKLDNSPRRKQDRNLPALEVKDIHTFINESDTDFDLPQNQRWATTILNTWKKSGKDTPYTIPVKVGNQTFDADKKISYFDRSQEERVEICQLSLSSLDQTKEMIALAEADGSKWRQSTIEERNQILHKVATNLSNERGNFIGCMAAITGKTFYEGDIEVSEAIDFCRYYPNTYRTFEQLEGIRLSPKGIILVVSPWNFPLAIPIGGVAAALAGGNSVILKPATSAFPVAWEFAQCFWNAGVPHDALQVYCPESREALAYLTQHKSIKHTILTGGTETAFRLLEQNPRCPLSAETGGKNAIIVTALGDRDHAIQNIVTSAFSNSGQKCSACSLLLLEREVFEDKSFQQKMVDAVTSLHTGSAWDWGNKVGPMIDDNNEKLLHAVNHLEPGEWWLVAPTFVGNNKFMLRPSVKWGVKPDSFTFKNELFGPLLAVVCIDSLEQGIEFVNKSDYGLTSGLQSLDEAEQELWKNSIVAGNLYINRGITGAIVSRQPFGGMKRSAFGGGIKAGGPNYVSCFVEVEEVQLEKPQLADSSLMPRVLTMLNVDDQHKLRQAYHSYERWMKEEFSVTRDIHQLLGEENNFRYLPVERMVLRAKPETKLIDLCLAMLASKMAKTKMDVSVTPDYPSIDELETILSANHKVYVESEERFISRLDQYDRVRCCNEEISEPMIQRMAQLGNYLANHKPLVEGRLELLHYLKEQSISYEYHRYGSIINEPVETI